MRCDILYCEGPGDAEASFRSWQRGDDFRSETSVTFSSQVFDFCAAQQLSLYAVSYCPRAARSEDGRFIVENKPRWQCRIPMVGYHLSLLVYTLRLLVLALRVRPQVILVCSGVVGWEFAALLRLSGARLVPVLHNALWPVGRRRGGLRQWAADRAYRFFWRACVWKTLAVSPQLKRQVEAVAASAGAAPVTVFQPSFPSAAFGDEPLRPDFSARPFRVLYVGRIEEDKGALDLVEMAAVLLASRPGGFEFDVCGDGSALPELHARVAARGLGAQVRIFGRLDRPQIIERYRAAHAVVVPTRASFAEGFAMVVAEAILCLRPVVSSPVVPAAEMFASAVLMAKPDDVMSYVQAIGQLSADQSLYESLVEQAQRLRSTVLDGRQSFVAALRSLAVPAARAAQVEEGSGETLGDAGDADDAEADLVRRP